MGATMTIQEISKMLPPWLSITITGADGDHGIFAHCSVVQLFSEVAGRPVKHILDDDGAVRDPFYKAVDALEQRVVEILFGCAITSGDHVSQLITALRTEAALACSLIGRKE